MDNQAGTAAKPEDPAAPCLEIPNGHNHTKETVGLSKTEMLQVIKSLEKMKAAGYDQKDPRYQVLLKVLNLQAQQTAAVPAAAAPATAVAEKSIGPFTQAQVFQLKAQILAYKYLSRNDPLPQHLLEAIRGVQPTTTTITTGQPSMFQENAALATNSLYSLSGKPTSTFQPAVPQPQLHGTSTISPSQKVPPVGVSAPSPGMAAARSASVGGRPPFYTGQPMPPQTRPEAATLGAAPPSTVSGPPAKVEPQFLVEEREKRIATRIKARTEELRALLPTVPEHLRRTALLELKQLELLELQKKVRQQVMDELRRSIEPTAAAAYKGAFRRSKKQPYTGKDMRVVERLELQYRADEEVRRARKHQEFLEALLQHSKLFREHHINNNLRTKKVVRAVLQFHQNVEKREQQRRLRQERERIQALRNDDEAGYMRLLEQTKNERLKQLLAQTDEFLMRIGALLQSERERVEMMEEEAKQEEADKAKPQSEEAEKSEPSTSKARPAEATETTEKQLPSKPADTNSDAVAKSKSYYMLAHSIEEEVRQQPDSLVGGQLKEYQLVGLQWLVSLYNNNLNGILADEMGLGKTIQTIALITYLMEKKSNNGPYLIIVPLSTLANWKLEFERWAPSVTVVIYKGQPSERKTLFQQQMAHGKFNVALTTYEYVMKDKSSLAKIKWNYIIIDEGHRMKNHACKLSTTLCKHYHSKHRLLLTGTPLQNSLPELWSLLNFLLPSIFNSVENFEQWFNAPFSATGEKVEINEEETLLIINRLHKVLRPFLLRRLKQDVEDQLPDKVEKVLKCEFSAMQRRIYHLLSSKGAIQVDPATTKKGGPNIKGLMNTLMQLRKVCNHPYLFNPTGEYLVDETLIRAAGKFELLDRILPKLKAARHRVLMFSQMTSLLDIMEDFLAYRGYRFLRLDGSTKSEERGELLELFNAYDSPYFIFLLSTRAGGLGLNLQSADTVILFDSDWNPQIDLQAQDRAHRIGQTREVRVFRLVTLSSIEEKILERATYKLDLDAKIIQAGMFNKRSSASQRRAMLESLLRESSEAGDDDSGSDVPDSKQINRLLARTPEELELFSMMDEEREDRLNEEWKAAGNRGPRPPRLLQDHELPSWLQADEAIARVDETTYGRGFRERPDVAYGDGLTERQWAKILEEGGDEQEIEKMREKNLKRKQRRMARKARAETAASDEAATETRSVKERTEDENEEESTSRPELDGEESRSIAEEEEQEEEEAEAEADPIPKKQSNKRGTKRGRETDLTDQTRMRKRRRTAEVADAGTAGRGRAANRGTKLGARLIEVWKAVRDTTDDEGRVRSALFMKLPSKKEYPDYYTVIKEPIDLKTIHRRINDGAYLEDLDKFERDFLLLFANAQEYNLPDSTVFMDAVALQEVFKARFAALRDELRREEEEATGAIDLKTTYEALEQDEDDGDNEPDDMEVDEEDEQEADAFTEDGDEEEEEEDEEEDESNVSSDQSSVDELEDITEEVVEDEDEPMVEEDAQHPLVHVDLTEEGSTQRPRKRLRKASAAE